MTVPRGKTRELIKALNKIQDRIGEAMGHAHNDRDSAQLDKLDKALREAFDLCVEARGLYDPID